MEIRIQSLHFNAGSKLNDYVNAKTGHLEHLDPRILSADVCLKLDKSDTRENKVCEIRLIVPGNDLFAKSQRESFEEAVNHTVAALQHQIEKRKTAEQKS